MTAKSIILDFLLETVVSNGKKTIIVNHFYFKLKIMKYIIK